MNRKGNTDLLVPAIIILTVAAVMIIFGVLIIGEVQTSTVDQTATVTNESIKPTDAGVYLANAGVCGFSGLTITKVYNGSTAITISSTNYTISEAGLLVNLTSRYPYVGWNVSYTYNYGNDACLAANKSAIGLSLFGDYVGLIVLAVVISIIIGLIIVVFAYRSTKR